MIEDFVRAIRGAGFSVKETTMPHNRRVFIVVEDDGTRTEIPCVDVFKPEDYVGFYTRARGTTVDERLKAAGLDLA